MKHLETLATLSPFNNWLGLQIDVLEPGFCRLILPWSENLIGDPTVPRIHGGVLASLIDATGGAACLSMIDPKDAMSTIDLQINFLEQGLRGDFYCEAKAIRVGKKIATARMDVYSKADPNHPKLVSIGTGVYNIIRQTA